MVNLIISIKMTRNYQYKDKGKRLHISIKKIANTKDNAKIAIDMLEYIKTLIIALA